jgi:hypothetical protein
LTVYGNRKRRQAAALHTGGLAIRPTILWQTLNWVSRRTDSEEGRSSAIAVTGGFGDISISFHRAGFWRDKYLRYSTADNADDADKIKAKISGIRVIRGRSMFHTVWLPAGAQLADAADDAAGGRVWPAGAGL